MAKHLAIAVGIGGLMILGACGQGPMEQAGEARDDAVEAATGTEYLGDGPAENAGEEMDAALEDALDGSADVARDESEAMADALEDQDADAAADRIRDQGEAVADALEERADGMN